LTRGLLQKARNKARLEIFGRPPINAKYFEALQQELELQGNHVQIVTTNRDVAISKLQTLIVADEINRRRGENKPVMLNNESEAKLFLQLWTDENKDFIHEHLGTEDDSCKFILGILFAPGTAMCMVKHLQSVYQADAAHLQFGKYTFYFTYGSSANSNTSPMAFAILFGNEDTSHWTKFWTFAKNLHPHLDDADITIITDQDKRSKAAIACVLPNAKNFHCSWRRCSNIIKVSVSTYSWNQVFITQSLLTNLLPLYTELQGWKQATKSILDVQRSLQM
jgi:hypothetical protein